MSFYDEELIVEVRVLYRGRRYCLNRIVTRTNLDEITPSSGPIVSPMEMADEMKRIERRGAFVSMLSSQVAHELLLGLFRVFRRG